MLRRAACFVALSLQHPPTAFSSSNRILSCERTKLCFCTLLIAPILCSGDLWVSHSFCLLASLPANFSLRALSSMTPLQRNLPYAFSSPYLGTVMPSEDLETFLCATATLTCTSQLPTRDDDLAQHVSPVTVEKETLSCSKQGPSLPGCSVTVALCSHYSSWQEGYKFKARQSRDTQ